MEDGCGVISAGLYLQSWRCKVDATCLMCHVCIQSSRPHMAPWRCSSRGGGGAVARPVGPVGTPRVEATDHGAVTRPRRAPAGGVGARAGKLAYRSPIGADGPDRAVRPPVAASAARSGCVYPATTYATTHNIKIRTPPVHPAPPDTTSWTSSRSGETVDAGDGRGRNGGRFVYTVVAETVPGGARASGRVVPRCGCARHKLPHARGDVHDVNRR